MNAIELLRKQFEWVHATQEGTVADLTQEGSDFNDLGKAIPAGAAYAHSVLGEDQMISTMLAHKEPIFTTASEIGLSEPMPGMDKWEDHERWYKAVKVDVMKFKEYAKKVYEATDLYLSTLTEGDLEKEIEMAGMKQPLAYFLSNFFLLHVANLTGEISAAKGVQGLKGYPW